MLRWANTGPNHNEGVGKAQNIYRRSHNILQFLSFQYRKPSMGDVFKALASEQRRRILNLLAVGPMTVGEIGVKFDMELPSISKHLSVLREAGLIRQQKRGQHVIYSLAGDHAANTLYSFLSPFCPEARRITRERRLELRTKKRSEFGE
jgi:ArsR family transcriptional regulator, arsenate/arsenite/antimonite-responsive transcriptional repressor